MTTDSQRDIDSTLDDALLSPEDGVPEPSTRQPGSFTSQIGDLEPGATACRLHKIDPTLTLDQMGKNLTQMRAQFRNNAAPSVRRAAARTGGEYTTEVCEFVSPRGTFYLAVIVTRIA